MNLVYKKIVIFAVSSLAATSIYAQSKTAAVCPTKLHLKDFTFYSLGDATVSLSDFQGLTGSGQTLKGLSHFTVNGMANGGSAACIGLTAGHGVYFTKGAVSGSVETKGDLVMSQSGVTGNLHSPAIKLYSSGFTGIAFSKNAPKYNNGKFTERWKQMEFPMKADHEEIFSEAIDLKNKLNAMKAIDVDCETLSKNDFDQHKVVQILATELNQCSTLVLKGSAKTKAVIRVNGNDVSLIGLNIKLRGGLAAGNIIWNMSDVENLFIANTATAYPGLPGHVFAPSAMAEFYNGLITGSLVVGTLNYNEHDARVDKADGGANHTGQINSPDDGGHLPYE